MKKNMFDPHFVKNFSMSFCQVCLVRFSKLKAINYFDCKDPYMQKIHHFVILRSLARIYIDMYFLQYT